MEIKPRFVFLLMMGMSFLTSVAYANPIPAPDLLPIPPLYFIMPIFTVMLVSTMAVETGLGTLMLFRKDKRLRTALTIAGINMITLPIVWFILVLIPHYLAYLLIAEIFAVVIEAIIYRIVLKDKFKNFASAILFSLVLNTASFVLGNGLFSGLGYAHHYFYMG